MKHTHKALILACALATTGLAQAERATFTVNADDEGSAFGLVLKNLSGSGSLTFSEDLMGTLQTAAIATTGVGNSTVTDTGASLSVSLEFASLRGTVDTSDWTYTAERVKTSGGALMTAATKNFATTGGSLSVTGIVIDLAQKAIYANLLGSNGVGTVNNVHVWTYGKITNDNTYPAYGPVYAANTLSELTITDNAFGLFAQSLGLRTGGINAMRAITDYGTMRVEITTSLPEPSTYAMMGLGLATVVALTRRRTARTTHRSPVLR